MGGNDRIILQERDLHLFRELAVMRVVDREQAKIVAGFASTSRANARLLALIRAGMLRRFFLGSGGGRKALYVLSPKGALAAQVPPPRSAPFAGYRSCRRLLRRAPARSERYLLHAEIQGDPGSARDI
jgi:hypothetical protein